MDDASPCTVAQESQGREEVSVSPMDESSPPPPAKTLRRTVAGKAPKKTVGGKGILKRTRSPSNSPTPREASHSISPIEPESNNNSSRSTSNAEEAQTPVHDLPTQAGGSTTMNRTVAATTPASKKKTRKAAKPYIGAYDSDWSVTTPTDSDESSSSPTPPPAKIPSVPPPPPPYIIDVKSRKALLKRTRKPQLVHISQILRLDTQGLMRPELVAALMVHQGPLPVIEDDGSSNANVGDGGRTGTGTGDDVVMGDDTTMNDANVPEAEQPRNMANGIVDFLLHEEARVPGVNVMLITRMAEELGIHGDWVEVFERAMGERSDNGGGHVGNGN